jgi:hypothetical protein
MSSACADGPRVRHALRGRLRVYVPGLSESRRQTIERRLALLPGVRSARASPLTGNVLVHFDPATTAEEVLLAELRGADTAEVTSPSASTASSPAAADPVALLPGWLRLGGALVGGALVAARHLGLWAEAIPGARALAALTTLIAAPPVRAALRHILGPTTAGLLCHLTELLAAILSGNGLGLTIHALQTLFVIGKGMPPV